MLVNISPNYSRVRLTGRETEVLTWTARGKTRHEISFILSISEETVKDYIEKACHKLNAVNKTQASTIAVILGLITPYKSILDENVE